MNVYKLASYLNQEDINEFTHYVYNMKWNQSIPTNGLKGKPNRYVNAFGTGADIDNESKIIKSGWSEIAWPVSERSILHENPMNILIKTKELPKCFLKVMTSLRLLVWSTLPDFQIKHTTFNLAVCRYYASSNIEYDEEPDNREWYPKDTEHGPIWAMITLYPPNTSSNNDKSNDIQVYNFKKKTWTNIKLPHESVSLMSSLIKRRFDKKNFTPRITITFKSTYSKLVNPLMNAMAVAYHSSQYRIPYKLMMPNIISDESWIEIYGLYKRLVDSCNSSPLQTEYERYDASIEDYKKFYDALIQKHDLMPVNYPEELVTRLLEMVCRSIC